MSTKSGTNAFHGTGAYMLRHQGLDANTFANNAQAFPSGSSASTTPAAPWRPDPAQQAVLLQQLSRAAQRPGDDLAADGADGAGARRQLQPDFIRDENGNRAGAHLRPVQRHADQLGSLPPRRDPERHHPEPGSARADVRFYPLPNRTPDDVFNTNNFESTTTQTVRRHSSNNRVDFKWKDHAIYGSGGISYAEVVTPRPFGTAPFNDAPATRGDKNPYIQIGDAVVLSPTLVLDVATGSAA